MPTPVRLLYFAGVREALGLAEESVSLPDGVATVARLRTWLEERGPALQGRLSAVRFAVNESFVEPNASITAGDVIALIPPVSGG